MNLFFLNPAMLWTALAGIIPIAIHLWYRDTGKIIEVGSTGWFQQADKNKIRKVKLHEKRLLLLRLLLLFLLSILLAAPMLIRQMPAPQAYQLLLIDQELIEDPKVVRFRDSVEALGSFETLYINDGAQQLNDSTATGKPWHILQNYSRRQFLPSSAMYFSSGRMQQFNTQRPTLNFPVTVVPIYEPQESTEEASFSFAVLQENKLLRWYEHHTETGITYEVYRDTIQQEMQPLDNELIFTRTAHAFYLLSAEEDTLFKGKPKLPLNLIATKEDSLALATSIKAIATYTGLNFQINSNEEFTKVAIGKESNANLPYIVMGDSVTFIGDFSMTGKAGLPANLANYERLTLLLLHLGNYTSDEIVTLENKRQLPEAMLSTNYDASREEAEFYEDELSLHYPLILLLCLVLIAERLYASRREHYVE